MYPFLKDGVKEIFLNSVAMYLKNDGIKKFLKLPEYFHKNWKKLSIRILEN